MLGNISGPTLIVILFIVLLLFGAPKLPALAKSLGQSMKILKKEVAPEDQETAKSDVETESVKSFKEPLAKETIAEEKLAAVEAELARTKAEAESLRQQAERAAKADSE